MDWKKIIDELISNGHTQQVIAEYCGCSQSSISDLSLGKTREPKASLAFRLLDLAKQPSVKEGV